MLNTFPSEWVDNFFHSGRWVYSVDMEDLCDYMCSKKKIADVAGIVQFKKNKTKDIQISCKIKHMQEINTTKTTDTNDEVGQVEQYNQCHWHPNHHHTWEECLLNPRNPNNKLKNKKQKRNEQDNTSTSNNNNNNQANPQQAPATEQRNLDQNHEEGTRVQTQPPTTGNIWEAW